MKLIGAILVLVCLIGGVFRGQPPRPAQRNISIPAVELRSDLRLRGGIPDNQLIVSYKPSLSQSANDRSVLTFAARNNLGPFIFRMGNPSTYLLIVPPFVPLPALGQALENDPAVLSVRRGHLCFDA